MEHRLPCAGTVVDNQAVSFRIQALCFGNFFCSKKKMADKFTVSFRHAVNLGYVPFGNDESMHGRLGVHVFECNDRLVLEHDPGWDFLIDDLAKNTVWIQTHDLFPSSEPEKLLKKQLRAPVWHAGPV